MTILIAYTIIVQNIATQKDISAATLAASPVINPNRKNKLNVWFIMHENEEEIKIKRNIQDLMYLKKNNSEINFEMNNVTNIEQCTLIV